MSIIDNLLVLLDDGKKRTLEDIQRSFPEYSKQIISATLGRILSKKFINKTNDLYCINSKGQTIITNNLEHIQLFDNRIVSKKMVFIMFNIPEKERLYRDILRNYLTTNGYGRLHNTVWISFNRNIKDLKKLLIELKISNRVIVFESDLDVDNYSIIVNKTNWNDEKTNIMYKQYIKSVEDFFKSKNKSKIKARCMVYEFAKIASSDPILPKKFLNNKYEGLKAFDMYLKLRKYCY